jgi:hypothetical protein
MDADQTRPAVRRARQVQRVDLPAGPARDLRDAVYRLYLEADRPTLEDLAEQIADDEDLPGAPKKDLIGKIVSGKGLASRQDTVSVAVALARQAGHTDAAALATKVRELWDTAKKPPPPRPTRLGRPISECDPFDLEVRRAITLPGQDGAAPALPLYVPRAHDARLGEVVAEVVAGAGRIVVLVGGLATGKTRACWEAIQGLPDNWRVWHPIEPGAAAAASGEVGSHTVVWLNEAQRYLLPVDLRAGERVAAGLRQLLADPARAPVLVLATVWPEDWSRLTSRPAAGSPDLYAQARELFSGADIRCRRRSRVTTCRRFTPRRPAIPGCAALPNPPKEAGSPNIWPACRYCWRATATPGQWHARSSTWRSTPAGSVIPCRSHIAWWNGPRPDISMTTTGTWPERTGWNRPSPTPRSPARACRDP